MSYSPSRLCIGIAACGCALPSMAAEPQANFDVHEYRVLGNTVLPSIDIERVLYPELGDGKTITDVEKARQALEDRYHEAGYGTVFVDIPEQQVDQGIVRLKVTEGRIDRVKVEGAKYFSGRIIKESLPEGAEGKVPHLPELQSQLTALNSQTPDRITTPVLKPGTVPGTLQLTLDVREQLPVQAAFSLNNQYSADTSHLRGMASVGYDNLFGRLDSISLAYQFTPQRSKEVDLWLVGYTARLPGDAGTLSASFIRSNSDVAVAGDGGSDISVLGRGKIYGLHWASQPHITSSSFHQLNAGVDYKDLTESIFSEDLLLTPISYANFSIGQNSAWRSMDQQFILGASANFGVRGVGNDTHEFEVKRFKGSPNYFLVRADSAYTRQLPHGTSLRVKLAGQYAVDSIVTNEQFAIAGSAGVRGFLEAEQLGDVGWRSSVEFGSPRWSLFGDGLQLDGFTFYDHGWMKRNNPLREQDPLTHELGGYLEVRQYTLRSTGVGLNLSAFSQHLDGAFVWAYPLKDSATAGGTGRGDARLLFSARVHW